MIQFVLLDIAPDPVRSGIGFTGLILVGIVVLILVVAVLAGFAFLIRRLTNRAGARTHLVVGDACLNLPGIASSNRAVGKQIYAAAQPENNPNQP
jgi:hypothetical protein